MSVDTQVKVNIPLQDIDYEAHLEELSAQVKVTQRFINQSEVPIEAVYVFPQPEEASVVGCEMMIGPKTIKAELKEKEQARREYREAVDQGHHGTLLEQQRPNIFTMNVGGVEPGEEILVVVKYIQRVTWQDNGGRFSIPLVVPPRFIPGTPTGKSGGGWAEDTDVVPDASQITPVVAKDGVPYTANIKVRFTPGFDCDISSPSHEFLIPDDTVEGKETRELKLENLTPDRDFILCYRTKSAVVGRSVSVGHFGGEEFAYISMIPPTVAVQSPRDVVLCLDVSGSMRGAKIEGLKVVGQKLVQRLQTDGLDHRVAVVAFDNMVHPIHDLSQITEATLLAISGLQPMGGTMAGAAIDHCMDVLEGRADRSRAAYILLVSDGQTEDRWTKTKGGRVVALGIDAAANLDFLRRIARETGGTSISIYPGEDYDTAATTLVGLLSAPVLEDLRVLSPEPAQMDPVGQTAVYQGMPANLVVRMDKLPDVLEVKGRNPQGKIETFSLDLRVASQFDFAHQIWAREKLRGDVEAKEQVALSLKYGVLCSHTSFVAISLKEVPGQPPERVEIPVALPHTWDYDSIFGGNQAYFASAIGAVVRGSPAVRTRGSVLRRLSVSSQELHSFGPPMPDSTKGLAAPSRTSGTGPSAGQPQQSMSTSYLVDDLEKLVSEMEASLLDRATTEYSWQVIRDQLEKADLTIWPEVDMAKCLYLLLRVRTFGLEVSSTMIHRFLKEPNEQAAREWWKKARSYMGVGGQVT